MEIQFREFNPFDVWIWLEFSTVPSTAEKHYIEELFDSWFLLGKLGGFNAENLQVQDAGIEVSYMEYSQEVAGQSMMAVMHNMGEVEYEGFWGRCWFDLGTSDALAIDILTNSFQRLDEEFVKIEKLIIGGQNEDWPVPENNDEMGFYDNN
ncbi:DUF3531 family protein [Okeania sp. KiyG1]|uniref:DUF3531 family protein n=1 Tax=Okeania sp. KiyG1 TaxID=2720165 RepID=UPI0019213C61|nr:DUF3531 family protein [Okeania sp. KiyG1]GGA22466.1 hypothetical protein CYANOKiyG1_37600 [Okeania sp. KiyG1]